MGEASFTTICLFVWSITSRKSLEKLPLNMVSVLRWHNVFHCLDYIVFFLKFLSDETIFCCQSKLYSWTSYDVFAMDVDLVFLAIKNSKFLNYLAPNIDMFTNLRNSSQQMARRSRDIIGLFILTEKHPWLHSPQSFIGQVRYGSHPTYNNTGQTDYTIYRTVS